MTGLSRCGRVYPTFDAAYKAAELRELKGVGKFRVTSCLFGEHWHVRDAGLIIGQAKRYRPDPFPPLVAALIDKRDEGQCQRCGLSTRLERHHRRAKGSGGSGARAHTQCPCNGLSLCRGCHREAHEHPAAARDMGVIVRQGVALPGRIGVMRFFPGGDEQPIEDEQWLTCTGQWVHCQKETED
jgi:hypothetical protein